MCFSASASFIGGAVITGIGIATLKQVQKPSQRAFASIPLFFGIQQIAEGFLWLSLQNPDFAFLQNLSAYLFLSMAQVIWPIMIPFSMFLLEENKNRRKKIRIILGIGLSLALYYAYCLISFKTDPQIVDCHIKYVAAYPKSLILITFTIYVFVTIAPLFISSIKKMYVLGVLMFFSCLVAVVFFTFHATSVWCFFAAIISVVIFWILRINNKVFAGL